MTLAVVLALIRRRATWYRDDEIRFIREGRDLRAHECEQVAKALEQLADDLEARKDA